MKATTKDGKSAKWIILRVDPETHRALKLRAAAEGTSIQRLVTATIDRHLIQKKGARP